MVRTRTVAATVAICWAVSFAFASWIELSTPVRLLELRTLLDLAKSGFTTAVTIGTLPGVIGGLLVAGAWAEPASARSLSSWLRRCVGGGAMLGAIYVPALALAKGGRGGLSVWSAVVLIFGGAGAIVGALVGCGVGVWCYRQHGSH